ncbi:MAG: hypothetical protein ABGX03_04580 [Methylophilaceae bacterium]
MAEDKIPVLTEVYKPKSGVKAKSTEAPALDVTADLIAQVTEKVKPRLESEISDFVLGELRTEIKKACNEVITSTKDFVDKTRADLKTELPKMHQESVSLSQVDVDNLKETVWAKASMAARKEVLDFQNKIILEHQQQINEAFANLREELAVEKCMMVNTATAEVKAIFTTQMSEVLGLLKQNIEEMLNKAIPDLENRVRSQLTLELQQLLLKVKFILPDS